MSAPAVSVIIVNWNGWRFMPACLAALRAQTYTDFEVIVVDNASTDGSVTALQRDYPWVHLIENQENVGFAVANNQALAFCRGQFIACLNNDTAADPGWLAALVGALEACSAAAGACGAVVALDEPERVIFTAPKIDAASGRAIWVNRPLPLHPADSLSGNCMLLRRAVIDRLGLFDPVYIAYYEETDWCARALRAGHELLYVPEAIVAHKEMGSAPGDFHAYQMERNRLRFALKNFDADHVLAFFVHYGRDTARSLARLARDGQWRQARVIGRALAWNLLNLPGTLAARRRDLARLGPAPRSYNRSLPLRAWESDGHGGLRPPWGHA